MNPQASSHPDKYNNSVNRIISKEEEREDIQGEILQSIFKYSGVSTFLQELQDFFEYSVFYKNYSASTCNPVIPCYSTYRINSSTRNTTTTRLIPCHPMQITTGHPPTTVPHASKHSTWQNPAIRPLQHKQASSNSTRQKQHSKRQPASTQSLQKLPGAFLQNSTRRNRILSKRIKYCMSMQY